MALPFILFVNVVDLQMFHGKIIFVMKPTCSSIVKTTAAEIIMII